MTGATSPGYPRVDGHAVTPLVAALVGGPDGAPVPLDPDLADTWFVADAPAMVPAADEELVLRAGGLATVATVSLGDEVLLSSESMFATAMSMPLLTHVPLLLLQPTWAVANPGIRNPPLPSGHIARAANPPT